MLQANKLSLIAGDANKASTNSNGCLTYRVPVRKADLLHMHGTDVSHDICLTALLAVASIQDLKLGPWILQPSHSLLHAHIGLSIAKMPVPLAAQVLAEGLDSIPFIWPVLKSLPWIAVLVFLKLYFSGTSNASERNMHGKVVLVTVS
jgi:hypothetical protein